MQEFQDFSSWQPDQERHFAVFEQRSVEASRRAWTVGLLAGVAFGIAMIGIAIAFKPPESRSQAAATENPDLASENVAPAAATSPTAPAPAAPANSAAPSAAPAADPTAPAAGSLPAPEPSGPAGVLPEAEPGTPGSGGIGYSRTPPPPPPGTTKAPPTALIKEKK